MKEQRKELRKECNKLGMNEASKKGRKEGRNKEVVRLLENCAPSKSLHTSANLLKKKCSFPNF